MNKKEASAIQEKMVANFLGWKVVSGSGSRPFAPGDVKNDHYLIECKTHVTEQNNIVFYKKHWEKIATEARSLNKYPALVVDNGTQKSNYTWVMIPYRVIISESSNKILNLFNSSTSGNTITYNHEQLYLAYKYQHKDDIVNYIYEEAFGEKLAVLSLDEFRNFYQEQFES